MSRPGLPDRAGRKSEVPVGRGPALFAGPRRTGVEMCRRLYGVTRRVRQPLQLRGRDLGDGDGRVLRAGSAENDADECRSLEEGKRGVLVGAGLERTVTDAGYV